MTLSKAVIAIAGAAAIGLLAFAAADRPDLILHNDSASVPEGFYVRVNTTPGIGAFVTVRAVDVAPPYATLRRFADPGDRLIKRVAASGGAEVCAKGALVMVGAMRLVRQRQDREGRALPTWRGCHVLRGGEFFLVGETSDSFDSRYFGIVRADQIEGVWRPL
jgi:conjugative transfer signal peptidase TraF